MAAAPMSRLSASNPSTRPLRDALIAAVNGNPVTADEAWALIHNWDAMTADREQWKRVALHYQQLLGERGLL